MTAIKRAIRYCETHDLMKEYFTQNEREVFDMVTFKWDDKKAREVAREEVEEARAQLAAAKMAAEEAAEKAAEKAEKQAKEAKTEGAREMQNKLVLDMLKNNLPVTLIAKISELPLEQIEKIAKENKIVLTHES